MATHIQIAATQGMKAGFNQRKQRILRGGLGIEVGTFADYCAKVGPAVTAYKASMRNKPRNARVVGVEPFADDSRSEEIAELRQRLAELESEVSTPASTPKPKPRKQAKQKVNVWHPWAVRKHSIPTKVGAEFTYKGKRRTSTFKVTKVTRDGSVESIRVK